MSFQPDEEIRSIAESSARGAVRFAKDYFNIDLDWSDNSITEIEAILDHTHKDYLRERYAENRLASASQLVGCYVGEVFRRNHGAVWGWVEIEGEKMIGLRLQPSGVLCWPIVRVRNRIVNGAQDNVWHYYQTTIAMAQSADAHPEFLRDGPLPAKSYADGNF